MVLIPRDVSLYEFPTPADHVVECLDDRPEDQFVSLGVRQPVVCPCFGLLPEVEKYAVAPVGGQVAADDFAVEIGRYRGLDACRVQCLKAPVPARRRARPDMQSRAVSNRGIRLTGRMSAFVDFALYAFDADLAQQVEPPLQSGIPRSKPPA